MKRRPFMRLTMLAFLMTSGLACNLRQRDWDYCAANAPCKAGYTCTPDLRCVREPDGGIDGAKAIDSQGAADAVGLPVDGTAPVLADGPASLVPGQDAGQPDQGLVSPQVDAVPRLDGQLGTITAPDAPPPTPDGGVPGSGGSGGATGGAPGSGGVTGSGGIATTAGVVASAGSMTTGGVPGSGGSGGSTGGAPGTGGVSSTGGSGGTGGATCQPKARDCTSPLDNNCNGTPDNQETTYCACPVSQTRACQEHPGYDGVGICKAGSQTCAASSDKTTSSWGACTGAVGPGTEICDAVGLDENCNGQSNEGCDCVNGTSIPCDCGPATTCTNGKKGTCSVSKVTLYRDADGDNYGDPARPAQVCPGTAGYVSNNDDCDDGDPNFKPSVSVCAADSITRKWCVSGGGGVTNTEACDQGCFNRICRNDGTIGLPGYVSCTNVSQCPAADGCVEFDPSGSCGTTGTGSPIIYCDGPNDCPGQKCVMYAARAINEAKCYATVPTVDPSGNGGSYYEVCDPMASTCEAPQVCTKQGLLPLYECE